MQNAALAQELRATQEKLRSSEESRRQLENQRSFGADHSGWKSTNQGGGERHMQEMEGQDKLVDELQRRVTELSRRNSELELQTVEKIASLRRQYESHIDALELELRRTKSKMDSGATPSRSSGTGYYDPSGSPEYHIPSSQGMSRHNQGRTPDSRKNLL